MVNKRVGAMMLVILLGSSPISAENVSNVYEEVPVEVNLIDSVELKNSEILVEKPVLNVEDLELDEIVSQIEIHTERKVLAHNLAESARALGYSDDHAIIKTAVQEWKVSNEYSIYYTELRDIKVEELEKAKEEEYPVAYFVWNYLDNLGYNDYVKAGIIGNMMVECGGGTLNLQTHIFSSGGSYYGLCQWSLFYNSSIRNTDIVYQLDYLDSNIREQIDTYGFCYKSGFNSEGFMSLEDSGEAALSFAKCYERCSGSTYTKRVSCADFAYDYFK